MIGEMSRLTGVHIETIRYYERISIMPQPDRTGGGNRIYNDRQLQRLTFIKRGRELGFGLDEIRELLDLVDSNAYTCGEIHAIATAHIKSVKQKIADLRKLDRTLKKMAAECSQGDVPDCPIIETLSAVPDAS